MPYKLTGSAHFSTLKKSYTKGQIISDSEYKNLTSLGKAKFTKVEVKSADPPAKDTE